MTKLSSVLAAIAASLFLAVLANQAEAMSKMQNGCTSDNNGRTVCMGSAMATHQPTYSRRHASGKRQRVAAYDANANSAAPTSRFSTNAVVNEARKYIGTNPTGRGSLWCGAFMDLVLKRTGHPGGGNLASAYARYGTRVSGPQIGALAVMGRRGGGHVGVVSGIDANGNPIIISGNTRIGRGPHTTLEHAYPRSRIYAYVMPR